jgi:hypothetical protein
MTEHGPTYNVASPALAQHRRLAHKGLAALTFEERRAYGAAVEAAILAMQRREAMRACVPGKRSNCASGTWYSDGADISAAIREQQRRALAACASQTRKARSDVEWATMYEAAMQDKARRIAERLLEGGNLWEIAA